MEKELRVLVNSWTGRIAWVRQNSSAWQNSSAAYNDLKNKQEKELAAAEEKLAECQETIYLLGKQLNFFHPRTGSMRSPYRDGDRNAEGFGEGKPTTIGVNFQGLNHAEIDTTASGNGGAETPIPLESCNTRCIASDSEANLPGSRVGSNNSKRRSTISFSSFSSSTPTLAKQSRGFSRFF